MFRVEKEMKEIKEICSGAALLATFGGGEVPEGWCQSLGAFNESQKVSNVVGVG